MGAATITEFGAATARSAPTRTLRAWHDDVRSRQRRGDLGGAIELLTQLIEVAPGAHVTRLRADLVVLLGLADRCAEADRLAVDLDPTDVAAWARLSRHARLTDDLELSIEAALGWEAAAPGDPVAAHFAGIARCLRDGIDHTTCPNGYVQEVFDHYSQRFDDHLAQLGYRGPQAIAALVHGLIDDGDLSPDAAIADLGCGTGLVGEHLRAGGADDGSPRWCGRLAGVDLAPKMLERAAARTGPDGIAYDELVEVDLVEFLEQRPDQFDAVVTADTFIYVGDLRPALAATATALRPGGWLVATVEHAADGRAAERGYVPDITGRYLHDADWLEAELARCGFDLVVIDDLSIRTELHRPVPGLVIVARRP